VKHVILDLLRRDGAIRALRPLRPAAATILFFHRFADPDAGNPGHGASDLRANLAFLRRHRFHLVSLGDLLAMLQRGLEPRPGTVVMTVDDGYRDFATVAAPIFAEYDCPVTVFLTTGFLDRNVWLWWNQLEFLFRETEHRQISLSYADRTFAAAWSSQLQAESEAARLAGRLESVSDDVRRQAITETARLLEVDLPTTAPARYAAMTWDDVRRCERAGASFGPHSATHPILSQVSDGAAAFEIGESWSRLTAETTAPVPVFCYPNGSAFTYGARELGILRSIGLQGAVTTDDGYVTAADFGATPDARFTVPRYEYYDDLPHFAQIVSGVERIKSVVRTLSLARRQSA